MKAISFCLNGKMAHFRKYYSNSTALSYVLPPVNTVKGILAGLLGHERDSYYALFSDARCKTALRLKAPVKKITQTMNLLKVESVNDLCGAGRNRTQNHTEFIVPKEIRSGSVCYEVIFWHEDTSIMDALSKTVCTGHAGYLSKGISLALGSSQCSGWLDWGREVRLTLQKAAGETIALKGAVCLEQVRKVHLDTTKDDVCLWKEENFTEFDEQRQITATAKKDLIFSLYDQPIWVDLAPQTAYFTVEGEEIGRMFVGG